MPLLREEQWHFIIGTSVMPMLSLFLPYRVTGKSATELLEYFAVYL